MRCGPVSPESRSGGPLGGIMVDAWMREASRGEAPPQLPPKPGSRVVSQSRW